MARILLIDDHELARYTMQVILESAGHDVVQAENGREGVELHAAQSFDLVVTDMIIPDVEGVETIKTLLEQDPTQRIIAVSGGGGTGRVDHLETASSVGAQRILQKPFSENELLECVTSCLRSLLSG